MHENAGIKYAILFPQVPGVRASGIFIFLIARNKTSLLKSYCSLFLQHVFSTVTGMLKYSNSAVLTLAVLLEDLLEQIAGCYFLSYEQII